MSIVRFATLCDAVLGVTEIREGIPEFSKCRARSDEYRSWPTCEDCGEDFCPDHQEPDSDTEDERNRCLCVPCAQARRED